MLTNAMLYVYWCEHVVDRLLKFSTRHANWWRTRPLHHQPNNMLKKGYCHMAVSHVRAEWHQLNSRVLVQGWLGSHIKAKRSTSMPKRFAVVWKQITLNKDMLLINQTSCWPNCLFFFAWFACKWWCTSCIHELVIHSLLMVWPSNVSQRMYCQRTTTHTCMERCPLQSKCVQQYEVGLWVPFSYGCVVFFPL